MNLMKAERANGSGHADKFAATGYPEIIWSKGITWPDWLMLDTTTGSLSGTPIAAEIYTLEIIASNDAGTNTKSFNIEVTSASEPDPNDPDKTDPTNPTDEGDSTRPNEPMNPTNPESNEVETPNNNGNTGDSNGDDKGSSEPDSKNAGNNNEIVPDLENPAANDAKPEHISELDIVPENSEEPIQAGAYTKNVKVTSLTTDEVRDVLAGRWANMPLCSVETDMDQIDTRSDTEKTDLIKEMIGDLDVLYAYVLKPMKPTKSGVFTFALPLPADMKVSDFLVFSSRRTLSSEAVSAINSMITVADTTTDETSAIFIDTVTKKETDVVPESRAVSVSTYLEAGCEYEPVVMTVSNEKAKSQLGPSGAGCSNSFNSHVTLATISLLIVLTKKKHLS